MKTVWLRFNHFLVEMVIYVLRVERTILCVHGNSDKQLVGNYLVRAVALRLLHLQKYLRHLARHSYSHSRGLLSRLAVRTSPHVLHSSHSVFVSVGFQDQPGIWVSSSDMSRTVQEMVLQESGAKLFHESIIAIDTPKNNYGVYLSR